MRRVLTPALLWLAACGSPAEIPKEDFPYWGAQVFCERTRECSLGAYEDAYFGMEDCRASAERDLLATSNAADDLGCDYDPVQAAQSYDEVATMSCEKFYEGDYYESMLDIWDDCLGFIDPGQF